MLRSPTREQGLTAPLLSADCAGSSNIFSGAQLESYIMGPDDFNASQPVVVRNDSSTTPAQNRQGQQHPDQWESPHGDNNGTLKLSCFSWLSGGNTMKEETERQVLRNFSRTYLEPFSMSAHEQDLHKLWIVSKHAENSSEPARGQPDAKWKELGFQGDDPTTDLSRSGSGVLPVTSLLYCAAAYPSQYTSALRRAQAHNVEKSYPFACAAIHLVDMILGLVGLTSTKIGKPVRMDAVARKKVVSMMDANQEAFFDIFCTSLMMLDAEWVRMNGTYFLFNTILDVVRGKLFKGLKQKGVKTPLDLAKAMKVPWRASGLWKDGPN